jgi:hypothetical protein
MKEEVKEKEKPKNYTKPRLINLQEEGLKPHWEETSGDCVEGYAVIGCVLGSRPVVGP